MAFVPRSVQEFRGANGAPNITVWGVDAHDIKRGKRPYITMSSTDSRGMTPAEARTFQGTLAEAIALCAAWTDEDLPTCAVCKLPVEVRVQAGPCGDCGGAYHDSIPCNPGVHEGGATPCMTCLIKRRRETRYGELDRRAS